MTRDDRVKHAFKDQRADEGNDCCEICRWRPPLALRDVAGGRIDQLLHAHHIVPIACGGPDTAANLIQLCPTHHAIAHHMGRMGALVLGGLREWFGPASRGEFVFAIELLRYRAEYVRFARYEHSMNTYLALVHDEAIAQDLVEDVRINRRFSVTRGRGALSR